MSRAWKSAEAEVSKFFGVERRVRVSYDESIGDTTPHPVYSIEVKWGKQVPKYLAVKTPCILRLKDCRRTFFLTPAKYWADKEWWIRGLKTRKEGAFLLDALTQAARYNVAKIPLVCVKPNRFNGFVIIQEANG